MVEDSFSAAHQLRDYKGPCEKLHGHTWKVMVFVSGDSLDSQGLGVDFRVIKQKLKELLEDFDHGTLNDLEYFKKVNPTSENLAKLMFQRLKGEFSGTFKLSRVTVYESEDASAAYYE